MAYQPIEYHSLEGKGTPGDSGGELTKAVYTSDATRDQQKDFLSHINPLFDTFMDSLYGKDTGGDEFGHVYEYINKFKTCDVMRVNPANEAAPNPTDSRWSLWRGGVVSPNVLLFPDSKVFQFKYTHEYEGAWKALENGLLGMVRQGIEGLRTVAALTGKTQDPEGVGGKAISQYKYAPAWIGTKPISLPSSLKFNFAFGQAGIFSGEHEVVRPILQLARMYSVTRSGEDNYFKGPVPTPPYIIANFFKHFGSSAISALSNALGQAGDVPNIFGKGTDGNDNPPEGSAGAASGIIGTLTHIEQMMLKQFDVALRDSYDKHMRGGGTGAIAVRIGRIVFGPALVKDVEWDFDFTQIDEYGFPYKGSLTFGGLENILMPDANQVGNMIRFG